MKESILEKINLSIVGRDVSMVLAGDNTREGGKEASRAAKVIGQMFSNYDTLTFRAVDRKDPRQILWCFKQVHDDPEKYVLDMAGGEFLAGLSE